MLLAIWGIGVRDIAKHPPRHRTPIALPRIGRTKLSIVFKVKNFFLNVRAIIQMRIYPTSVI